MLKFKTPILLVNSLKDIYGDDGFKKGDTVEIDGEEAEITSVDICALVDPPRPFANVVTEDGEEKVCWYKDGELDWT